MNRLSWSLNVSTSKWATDTNHLGFGFGRHFCLGAHLARMEIRGFYKELLGRLDHLELAAEPTWVRANFVQARPRSLLRIRSANDRMP